jgi:hypothetical protein
VIEQPKRRVRVFIKILLWIFGVLFGLLLLAWLALVVFFPDEKIKNILVSKLQQGLGVTVQAGELDLEILSGLSLNKVSIGAPRGFDEPIISIDRLIVDYSLADILSDKLVVHQVLVERPRIVFRQRAGKSNLQALFEGLNSKDNSPKQKSEKQDSDSEFVLDLKRLEVKDAHFVMQTPFVQAAVEGLDVSIEGQIGSSASTKLAAKCLLELPESANLSVSLKSEDGQQLPLELAVGFELEAFLSGFSKVSGKGVVEVFLKKSPLAESQKLRLQFAGQADASMNLARLEDLSLQLDQHEVLRAVGRVDQVAEILIEKFSVPTELSTEIVTRLVPDLKYSGSIEMKNANVLIPLEKEGGFQASTTIELNQLSVNQPPLRASAKSSIIEVSLAGDEAGANKVEFSAEFNGCRFSQPNVEVGDLDLTLQASGLISKLEPDVWLEDLSIKTKADFKMLSLAGIRLNRSGLSLNVSIDKTQWSETENLRVDKLQAVLGLRTGMLRASFGQIRTPKVDLSLSGSGKLLDDRFEKPFGVRLTVHTRTVQSGPASLESLDLVIKTRIAGLMPSTLPIEMKTNLHGAKLSQPDSTTLNLPDPVRLSLFGNIKPKKNWLGLKTLSIELEELLTFSANGEFNWQELDTNLAWNISPFELQKLVNLLPAGIESKVPRLSGKLGLEGKLVGRLPEKSFSIHQLPFFAESRIHLKGISTKLTELDIELDKVSGQVLLVGGQGKEKKTSVDVHLTLQKFIKGIEQVDLKAAGISLALKSSGDENVQALQSLLGVARFEHELLARPISASKLVADLEILGFKDLDFKRLQLDLPSLGLSLGGSLQGVFPRGSKKLSDVRGSGEIWAGFDSKTAVEMPGRVFVKGKTNVSVKVRSGTDHPGIFIGEGKAVFSGLDVLGDAFSIENMQGGIPVSQSVDINNGFALLAQKQVALGDDDPNQTKRSKTYDDALRPLKGSGRSFSINKAKFRDIQIDNLSGNLELYNGRLSLGSLRFVFLSGDVLADSVYEFAPADTRRITLDAVMSGVDISSLGELSLTTGASDINANLHLTSDWVQRSFSASVNLTQIGRSTLRALLVSLDPTESNSGIQDLRSTLQKQKIAPKRVSLTVRRGQLGMKVLFDLGGLMVQTMVGLIDGFKGETYTLPEPLEIGGVLQKYLGF